MFFALRNIKNEFFFLSFIYFLDGCMPVSRTGKETEQELITKNNIKSVTEYVTLVHLGVDEKENLKSLTIFNDKGNRSKETTYTEDGKIEFITTFEYDKNDSLILTTVLNSNNGFN